MIPSLMYHHRKSSYKSWLSAELLPSTVKPSDLHCKHRLHCPSSTQSRCLLKYCTFSSWQTQNNWANISSMCSTWLWSLTLLNGNSTFFHLWNRTTSHCMVTSDKCYGLYIHKQWTEDERGSKSFLSSIFSLFVCYFACRKWFWREQQIWWKHFMECPTTTRWGTLSLIHNSCINLNTFWKYMGVSVTTFGPANF